MKQFSDYAIVRNVNRFLKMKVAQEISSRMLTDENLSKLEEQITEEKKTVDFDTREFTIEFLVQKYLNKVDTDENDIFVPEYQRDFVWDDSRQSRLVESIVLGLPIPIIFLAEDRNGRLEIVDGSQRIRTLAAFLSSELRLSELEKLTLLNGLTYADLPDSRRRKINNTAIRMIVLSETATEDVKNDLFERINRGSDILRSMEKRKGIYRGDFNKFIYETCAAEPLFLELAPLAKSVRKRQEHEELILRFFALVDQFPNFKTHRKGIGSVLDEYMEAKNKSFSDRDREMMLSDFKNMLEFVGRSFAFGFAKQRGHFVSRVYFEAVAVGSHLARKMGVSPPRRQIDVREWLDDPKFKSLTSTKYVSHEPHKLRQRIEFVRDKLLAAQ